MDLDDSPEIDLLRRGIRELISREAPAVHLRNGTRVLEDDAEWSAWKTWSARLYETQMVGRSWPIAFGGISDPDPLAEFMVASEIARARVPPHLYFATYAAHAISQFGTDAQKAYFLPRTRSSEIVWCQLFSEPSGGSDLGALKTRAHRAGERYLINGQKVWNTQAQRADFGFLLARTAVGPKKHDGITAFLIDMSAPGVEIRPIKEITGTEDFNEVFFADAQVPVAHRLGAEGEGWRIAMSTLAKERINTAAYGATTRKAMDDLLVLARERAKTGALSDGLRSKLVNLHASCQISDLLGLALASRERSGRPREADPPIAKAVFSATNLDVASTALELLGDEAVFDERDPRAPDRGRWPDMFLYARAYTIAGGSSEIVRNIISERVLGMPRAD